MKIRIRFDAFDLREALTDATIRSLPADVAGLDTDGGLVEAREERYREALAPWVDSSGQDSGHDRIVVEFDLDAGPPTARVLRRDGLCSCGRINPEYAFQMFDDRRPRCKECGGYVPSTQEAPQPRGTKGGAA